MYMYEKNKRDLELTAWGEKQDAAERRHLSAMKKLEDIDMLDPDGATEIERLEYALDEIHNLRAENETLKKMLKAESELTERHYGKFQKAKDLAEAWEHTAKTVAAHTGYNYPMPHSCPANWEPK